MKKMIMRLLSIALVLVLLIPMVPTAHAASGGGASYEDIYASVEKQVKEFAKSIYYANADDDALWALAKHGLTNRTTLKAGKTHALTVTLYNSNLLQNYLIKSLMAIINYPIDPDVDTVYAMGKCMLKGGEMQVAVNFEI